MEKQSCSASSFSSLSLPTSRSPAPALRLHAHIVRTGAVPAVRASQRASAVQLSLLPARFATTRLDDPARGIVGASRAGLKAGVPGTRLGSTSRMRQVEDTRRPGRCACQYSRLSMASVAGSVGFRASVAVTGPLSRRATP
ncbi:hypothetical protein PybrP1_006331 [[Pythium] brassicae (nom. inval.)]|nr:hypothetical protein PybrP1_006331 [[Pythium] brassicae (nom. inval.)]